MRLLRILMAALVTLAGASISTASADVAPMGRVRAAPRLRLASVQRTGGDAPAPDAAAVEREAREALYGTHRRLQRCLEGLDLREDPLRRRTRSLTGTLTFARSARPTVRVQRSRGLPAAAEACVLEAVRSVAVRTVPRGEVQVRFRYEL